MHNTESGTCGTCGQKTENGRGTICYGCYLDSLIPRGYEGREKYYYDGIYKIYRALLRPKTGVALLDSTPLRLSELDLPKGLTRPRF